MGNLYTIKEACSHFGISRKTLFNWRKSNKIKSVETKDGVLIDIDSEKNEVRKRLHSNEENLISLIQELHGKIDILTQELHTIKQSLGNGKVKVTQEKKSIQPSQSANEKRKKDAIDKARAKFIELGKPAISRAELARQAGVDRNSVGKHWKIITSDE